MSHLNSQEKKALDLFKENMEQAMQGKFSGAKLFGSKARGEANKFSDLDVLVILSAGDWQEKSQVHQIANEIFLDTGVDISPKIFTKSRINQLRAFGSPFIQNVDREGIAL